MKDNWKLQIRILRYAKEKLAEGNLTILRSDRLAEKWDVDSEEVRDQFRILIDDDLVYGDLFDELKGPCYGRIRGLKREGHREAEKAESWYPHHRIERAAEAMGPTSTLAKRALNIFNLAALILGYILGQFLPWPW